MYLNIALWPDRFHLKEPDLGVFSLGGSRKTLPQGSQLVTEDWYTIKVLSNLSMTSPNNDGVPHMTYQILLLDEKRFIYLKANTRDKTLLGL